MENNMNDQQQNEPLSDVIGPGYKIFPDRNGKYSVLKTRDGGATIHHLIPSLTEAYRITLS